MSIGRHKGLGINEWLCPFCENKIETEQHFLIRCEKFKPHREEFFAGIKEIDNDFDNLDENEKTSFQYTHFL